MQVGGGGSLFCETLHEGLSKMRILVLKNGDRESKTLQICVTSFVNGPLWAREKTLELGYWGYLSGQKNVEWFQSVFYKLNNNSWFNKKPLDTNKNFKIWLFYIELQIAWSNIVH